MFKKFKNKETLHLNNNGNHLRDFTYIDDAVLVLEKLLKKKFINHEIFNVCSNNPINILDVVNIFRKKYKLKVKFTTRHKADALITHGNNKKVLKKLNIKKFSNFRKMFWSTYKWYEENQIFNY
jgi:nucleoside-diphosphate-sugar epimerase